MRREGDEHENEQMSEGVSEDENEKSQVTDEEEVIEREIEEGIEAFASVFGRFLDAFPSPLLESFLFFFSLIWFLIGILCSLSGVVFGASFTFLPNIRFKVGMSMSLAQLNQKLLF